MKNLILFVVVLLLSVGSFAQKKSIDENLTQLMYAKNGMGGIENFQKKVTLNIPDNGKKAQFVTKISNLETTFLETALVAFKKDYSNEDIIAIYNEFTSDKLVYEDRTVNFFSKFRQLKGQFFKKAKALYVEYSN